MPCSMLRSTFLRAHMFRSTCLGFSTMISYVLCLFLLYADARVLFSHAGMRLLAMPCLDLCAFCHVLCLDLLPYCLYAWIHVLPCLCAKLSHVCTRVAMLVLWRYCPFAELLVRSPSLNEWIRRGLSKCTKWSCPLFGWPSSSHSGWVDPEIISSVEGPDDEMFPAQEALLHIQTRIVDLVPEKDNIITTRLLVPSSDIGCLEGRDG